MPWNEPGKGNKDPWQSGNNQPPDLDDVFKSLSNRIKGLFGGKPGGRNGASQSGSTGGPNFLLLALVAAVLWTIYDSPHKLDESERGVVLRFGEYSRTLQPGLRFTLPRPFERVEKVNVTAIRKQKDSGRMLTADENLITIEFEVQYLIDDAQMYLFNVRGPDETVLQAAESAIREIAGTNEMDFILEEGRREVAQESRALLQGIMDSYKAGITITLFNLPDVKPPVEVQAAFDDVVTAREDQQRFVNEAQAYANQIIPEARGEAARVIQEANGYRESVIAVARGEADRFTLLLTEYQKAPEVTRERLYLQTMEEVLTNSNKVFLDVDSSGNLLYLPLDGMSNGNGSKRIIPPIGGLPGNNSQTSKDSVASEMGRDGRRGGRPEGRSQ